MSGRDSKRVGGYSYSDAINDYSSGGWGNNGGK